MGVYTMQQNVFDFNFVNKNMKRMEKIIPKTEEKLQQVKDKSRSMNVGLALAHNSL